MTDSFIEFDRTYRRWAEVVETISTRGMDGLSAKVLQTNKVFDRNIESDLEIDVVHMIDDIRVLVSAIRESPTKFDYPKIACERLKDVEVASARIESAFLPAAEASAYREFIAVSRHLLDVMSSLPVPEEGHLGFRRAVLIDFDFLRADFGFNLVDSSPVSVQFVSDAVEVELQYSPQLPELTLEVVVPTVREWSPFRLDDFFYSAGLGLSFPYECFDLLTESGLAVFIDKIATFIKINAVSVLQGDQKASHSLAAKAREREEAYCSQMARREADR